MKLPHQKTRERQAFTLVELMVVLTIIALLVSLISIAVVKSLGAAKRTSNRVDISQIDTALTQFKLRFGFYPPSQLILCEQRGDYYVGGSLANPPKTALHADSLAILSRMFPYMDWTSWNTPVNGAPPWQGIDWNGNTLLDNTTDFILEGDQCLVFFLGGIPSPCTAGNGVGNALPLTNTPPACQGFAANPKNPADPSSTDRIGPFHEFSSSRLVLLPLIPAVTTAQASALFAVRSPLHYSYLDRYGQSDGFGSWVSGFPYAFFSSNKGPNAYNPYITLFAASDCPTLGVMNSGLSGPGIWPYAEVPLAGSLPLVPVRYVNPNTYQIVSAGADQQFGSGSVPTVNGLGQVIAFSLTWTAVNPPASYTSGTAGGYDDQSSFSSSVLGAFDK